jgi:hypothetical protein
MITVGESGLIDGPISVKSTHPQTRSFCHYDGEFINGKKSGIWEVNRKMGDIDTRFTLQITYEKDVCQRSALKGVFDLESKEYFEYYMEGSSSCDVDGIGMVARKRYLDGAESQTESMFDSEKAP